jgi:hypothetical protein
LKKEKELQDRDAAVAKQQFHDEKRRVSEALETASRNEVSLTQQLDEAAQRHQQERQRFDREIEELKRANTQQLTERDQRIEWMKAEYEKRNHAMESHHTSEVEREKARVDAALHQNEQLRRFFAEQKRNSTNGMSSLQSQLETHISRLQQHTQELRGDLSRASVPSAALLSSFGELSSPPRSSSVPHLQNGTAIAPGSLGSPAFKGSAALGVGVPSSGMHFPNLAAPALAPVSDLLGSQRLAAASPSELFALNNATRDLSPGFLKSAGISR